MKVLILVPMDKEIELLTANLQQATNHQLGRYDYQVGNIAGHEVILCRCGIGKVAAAVSASVLIQATQPDLVINTGSAGGLDTDMQVGDIVVANRCIQHDVDVTAFGYALGQPAGDMPAEFTCPSDIVNTCLEAAQDLPVNSRQGLVLSGDAFINNDAVSAQLKTNFPAAQAVEMEGAAVGHACYLLNTPYLVIRSISDIAGQTSNISFAEYLPLAGKNSAQLLLNLLQRL